MLCKFMLKIGENKFHEVIFIFLRFLCSACLRGMQFGYRKLFHLQKRHKNVRPKKIQLKTKGASIQLNFSFMQKSFYSIFELLFICVCLFLSLSLSFSLCPMQLTVRSFIMDDQAKWIINSGWKTFPTALSYQKQFLAALSNQKIPDCFMYLFRNRKPLRNFKYLKKFPTFGPLIKYRFLSGQLRFYREIEYFLFLC